MQRPHDRELGQRHRVDAARGGGGQAAAVEPGPLHERPDAGAGRLHPAQPPVLGQVRHPGRVEPVEIEEHVGAGRDRPPPRQVALAQVASPPVVVAAVPWHREQVGLVGDPRHRRGGRDPRHQVRLQVGADDDGQPGGRLGHAELLQIALYQSIVDYRPSPMEGGPATTGYRRRPDSAAPDLGWRQGRGRRRETRRRGTPQRPHRPRGGARRQAWGRLASERCGCSPAVTRQATGSRGCWGGNGIWGGRGRVRVL